MATYRLFKPKYTGRDGRKRQAAKWYVEIRDHNSYVRRLPAFTSKDASHEMGKNLAALVAYFSATGGQTNPALQSWLEILPASTRTKLVSIGLLAGERVAACKPLSDHLEDFASALTAKGNTVAHVEMVTGRARKVIDGCGFRFHGDIKPSKVMEFLNELRQNTEEKDGISAQTFNFYLQAVKQFCKWMVKDRRTSDSPLAHLSGLNVKTDRRRMRRALQPDELRIVLATAMSGPTRSGVTGPARVLLYRLALETGLRQNELRSLTRSSFAFDGNEPTVTVQASYSKHRREDVLPIRPALATELREFLAMHTHNGKAFRVPPRKRMAEIFRLDVEAAGVPYIDEAGMVADFHSLRHTFITNLARGGIHPKTAQQLARHCSITLTMDRYSHTVREELSDALAVLPDLGEMAPEQMQATGTGGKFRGATDKLIEKRLALCLARSEGRQGTLVDSGRMNTGEVEASEIVENAGSSATKHVSGSVCTSGGGPGLQNLWRV